MDPTMMDKFLFWLIMGLDCLACPTSGRKTNQKDGKFPTYREVLLNKMKGYEIAILLVQQMLELRVHVPKEQRTVFNNELINLKLQVENARKALEPVRLSQMLEIGFAAIREQTVVDLEHWAVVFECNPRKVLEEWEIGSGNIATLIRNGLLVQEDGLWVVSFRPIEIAADRRYKKAIKAKTPVPPPSVPPSVSSADSLKLQINSLLAEKKAVALEIETIEGDFKSSTKKISSLKSNKDKLQAILDKIDEQIANLKKQLSDLNAKRTAVEEELINAEVEYDELKTECQPANDRLEVLKSKRVSLNEVITYLEKATSLIESDLS